MPPQPPADTPDLQLHCLWGDRLATAQEGAQALLAFLAALAPHCPPGSSWHTLGRRNELTLLPADADGCRLVALQPGNGSKRGVPPEATFPAVGFHTLLVTAGGDQACALHLTQGMQGPHAHNELTLRFPQQGAAAQAWLTPERMDALLAQAIACWQPDLACVFHTDMRDMDVGYPLPLYWYAYCRRWPDDLGERLGELTYGAKVWPAAVAPGQVVRSTPERYDRRIPDHQAASEALKARLKGLGLLPPPSPFL